MYKKEILSGIVGVVLGALIGGSIVYAVYVPGLKEANQELEGKVETARSMLAQGEEAYSISGSIERVEGNIIFVKTNEDLFPLDNTPDVRRVVVTEDTTITTWKQKDPDVYQAELEEYERRFTELENQNTESAEEEFLEIEYPLDVETITLNIEDLKPGDRVTVDSVFMEGENEEEILVEQVNIKFKEEFEASSINVTPEDSLIEEPDPNEQGEDVNEEFEDSTPTEEELDSTPPNEEEI